MRKCWTAELAFFSFHWNNLLLCYVVRFDAFLEYICPPVYPFVISLLRQYRQPYINTHSYKEVK